MLICTISDDFKFNYKIKEISVNLLHYHVTSLSTVISKYFMGSLRLCKYLILYQTFNLFV